MVSFAAGMFSISGSRQWHLFTSIPSTPPFMLAAAMLLAASPRMAQAEALLLIEVDNWQGAAGGKRHLSVVSGLGDQDHDGLCRAQGGQGRPHDPDTLLTVSPAAAAQSPSKMGFKPGTQVTLDNALK